MDHCTTEVIVGEIEHFKVAVHGQLSVWLESKHDVLQVLVLQATCSKEDHLQFLAFRDKLGEETDLLRLVFLCGRLDLVKLVSTSRRVTCLKLFGVDGIPVEEKICDRAVVFAQVPNQSGKLRVCQAVIAEPKGKYERGDDVKRLSSMTNAYLRVWMF